MTDSAKLDLLLSEMQAIKTDIHILKEGFSSLQEDVSALKEDVSTLKMDVSALKEDVSTLKMDVSALSKRVSTLEEKVDKLTQRTDAVENQVIQTNLILENEIRVNIQRVAEGHLDLSRNLHEAMQPNNEVEMLSVRVSMLESDMRKVKAKLA